MKLLSAIGRGTAEYPLVSVAYFGSYFKLFSLEGC